MPKGFSPHEKEHIQERLLAEGERLFSAFGLKKTNIEELANAAGISKGAFYQFYSSKEDLFMDVVERAEISFRQQVLDAVDRPGDSPHSRLFVILQTSFRLWKTIPLLQFFSSSEVEVLARRVPPEKIQQHLQSDRSFTDALIERCQTAGIPICIDADLLDGLLHSLFFTSLHEGDLAQDHFHGALEILLDLTAGFCLGEFGLSPENPAAALQAQRGDQA